MLKVKRPLPTATRVYRPLTDEEKAKAAAEENARLAAIADSYFSQAPSAYNLARGTYAWAKSLPWLLGSNENPESYSDGSQEVGLISLVSPAKVLGAVKKGVTAVGTRVGRLVKKTEAAAARRAVERRAAARKAAEERAARAAESAAASRAEAAAARTVAEDTAGATAEGASRGTTQSDKQIWVRRHPYKTAGLVLSALSTPSRDYVVPAVGYGLEKTGLGLAWFTVGSKLSDPIGRHADNWYLPRFNSLTTPQDTTLITTVRNTVSPVEVDTVPNTMDMSKDNVPEFDPNLYNW